MVGEQELSGADDGIRVREASRFASSAPKSASPSNVDSGRTRGRITKPGEPEPVRGADPVSR